MRRTRRLRLREWRKAFRRAALHQVGPVPGRPRHPKQRDVNLGATVPGWTRYTIAEQMLGRFHGPSVSAQEDISRDFQAFLNRIGSHKARPIARPCSANSCNGANNGVGEEADVAV